MVPPHERFALNDGVKIRFLDNGIEGGPRLPVVFSPGITDFAEDYLAMFELFIDRRLVVVELRGRGGSDAPATGYSVQALAGDLTAVAAEAALSRLHLMTFSRGTTPAIEFASRHPRRIVTVSIGDYRAVEIHLTPAFVDQQWGTRWRGRPIPDRVRRHVLEGIQAESVERSLWSTVAALALPVLVARGESGGLLDDAACDTYRRRVPGVEIVTIPGSGHDLFRPDRLAYPRAVLDFIARRTPET